VRSQTTLDDVAAIAKVSPRTVSRVVNEEGGFGEETKKRVLAAIEELGYRPNLLARALMTRRSGTIALVCPDITDPFFAELADSVQRTARTCGRTVFFASNGHDPALQLSVLESLRSHAAEGVILFPAEGTRSTLPAIAKSGLPMVLIDHDLRAPWVGSVSSTISFGAELAVEHLVSRGCRAIGMAANSDSVAADIPARREHGYRRALHKAGFAQRPDLIAFGSPTIEGGRGAVDELLSLNDDLDAVFAYNDLMAVGALQSLARAGKRVPEDVAVVGFNDIALCSALLPALTTVRINRDQVAKEAVELLLRIGERPNDLHGEILVDVELILRSSA
jgi:LacI family transcriptional regulator